MHLQLALGGKIPELELAPRRRASNSGRYLQSPTTASAPLKTLGFRAGVAVFVGTPKTRKGC